MNKKSQILKMDPKVKALWLAWLRDPKNIQGQYKLHRDDRFCCLGGLCDIYLKYKGRKWDNASANIKSIGDEMNYLPKEVTEWAGWDLPLTNFGNFIPFVMYEGKEVELSILNDREFLPFSKLASLIEEQL